MIIPTRQYAMVQATDGKAVFVDYCVGEYSTQRLFLKYIERIDAFGRKPISRSFDEALQKAER